MYLAKEEVDKLEAEGLLGTGVYLIFNEQTGYYYVGSSIDTRRRLLSHLRELTNGQHRNSKFQNAFDKNPNFQFAAMQIENRDDAFEVEDSFLKWNAGDPKFLNLATDVEKHRLGQKATAETKQKQSIAAKAFYERGGKNSMEGKKLSSEAKLKLSEIATQQFSSEDARLKSREKTLELFQDPEFRERQATATREAMSRPELRERLSERAKSRMSDPEQREQLSEAAKRRSSTPEGLEHLRANGKKVWENPEYRLQRSRRVNADGVIYESVTACAEAFDVTPGAIIGRIKSTDGQFKSWRYE